MRRSSSLVLGATLLALAVAANAVAVSRPIAGKKLQLKRNTPNGTWTFVAKGAFLFPPIGGPDDPQTAGALIEIFPTPGSRTLFAIPSGTGQPGWSAKPGRVSRLRFDNPSAPLGDSVIRLARLRQGRQIKIIGEALAGVTFGPDTTAMAIRITTGSLRSCVRFQGADIRRSDASIFVATNASADSLPDCSDGALGIRPLCEEHGGPACGGSCFGDGVCTRTDLNYCVCVSPAAPCGSTEPTCNGACPAGQTCNDLGTGCGCLPDGAAACGTPGLPTCGGECPDDQVCRPIFVNGPPVTFGCGCGAPTTCSDSGGGIECGNGMACGASPAFGGIGCIPIFCGDSCGQPCGDGGQCSRVRVGTSDFCACAVPEPCCDGGLVCPPFQTCVQGSSCGGCQSLF